MARKPLSSCFDCIHLSYPSDPKHKDQVYWCDMFGKAMGYDVARTPNDCPKKVRDFLEHVPNEVIVERFYANCCELAETLGRPLTVREIFERLNDYTNRNSLWELLEILVKTGKLEKGNGIIRTWRGKQLVVSTYWPGDLYDIVRRQVA